jgi:hypothetical protein
MLVAGGLFAKVSYDRKAAAQEPLIATTATIAPEIPPEVAQAAPPPTTPIAPPPTIIVGTQPTAQASAETKKRWVPTAPVAPPARKTSSTSRPAGGSKDADGIPTTRD